jgi:hypothetical protein
MSDDQQPEINLDEPATYEVRIKGHLGQDWEDWFDNTSISQTDNGETILTCTVQDQSALHGLLRRIRDLGIPLISVVQINADNAEE